MTKSKRADQRVRDYVLLYDTKPWKSKRLAKRAGALRYDPDVQMTQPGRLVFSHPRGRRQRRHAAIAAAKRRDKKLGG